jgi:arginine decarboxylase
LRSLLLLEIPFIKVPRAKKPTRSQLTTPREAFFSDYEVVDSADAVGRVSAEMICPYPPGVPVLSPGELITEAALSALFEARDMGVRIAFVADPTLNTLKVLPKN